MTTRVARDLRQCWERGTRVAGGTPLPLKRRPSPIADAVEPHADKPRQCYAVAHICRLDRLATTIAGQSAASSDFMEPIRRRERQSTTSRPLYGQCRA
jgi:hypothetical protein